MSNSEKKQNISTTDSETTNVRWAKRTVCVVLVIAMIAGLIASLTGSYAQTKKSVRNNSPSKYFFIGDSRTVGMYDALHGTSSMKVHANTGNNEYWSAECGDAYTKLMSTDIPKAEEQGIKSNDVVFILMGVNDCTADNAKKYASTIITKQKEWGCKVFYVSVNPVNESKAKEWSIVTQAKVNTFNNILKTNLKDSDVAYLDTASAIKEAVNSGGSPDGIHYTSEVYKQIYSLCIEAATPKASSLKSYYGTELPKNSFDRIIVEPSENSDWCQYKYIVHNEDTDDWFCIKDYSTKKFCNWLTGDEGEKTVFVDVKDSRGTVVRSNGLRINVE